MSGNFPASIGMFIVPSTSRGFAYMTTEMYTVTVARDIDENTIATKLSEIIIISACNSIHTVLGGSPRAYL